MRYFSILAIPSILATASHPFPRQEASRVAIDADKLLILRAGFCLDYTKLECEEAIQSCQADESQIDEECILNEHPTCIEDERSFCSEAAAQCLADYGEEEDAEQAVEACIIEGVFPEGESEDFSNEMMEEEEEEEEENEEENEEEEEEEEEEAPGSSVSPEQAAACKKASAEYELAFLEQDCKKGNGAEQGVDKRSQSSACEAARATFEKTWTENDCDAAIRPRE